MLPSVFFANIDTIIGQIASSEFNAIEGLDGDANGIVSAIERTDSVSASNSSKILDSLDIASQSWNHDFSNARSRAIDNSERRIGNIGNIADNAVGIAGMVSATQRKIGSMKSLRSKSMETAQADLKSMIQSAMNSVTAANATLTRASGTSSSQSEFGSGIHQGKASRLLEAMKRESGIAYDLARTTGDALTDATGRQAIDLKSLDDTLQQSALDRSAKMSSTIRSLGDRDSDFAKNISSNQDAVTTNLMLAKRAVRDLISSWSGYADYEIDKFEKMANVDQDFISMISSHVNTSTMSSEHKLLNSRTAMKDIEYRTGESVTDYIQFENSTSVQTNMLFDVIPRLNKTATASLAQLSETATQFDVGDNEMDVVARASTLDAISRFEKSLDDHAQMAIAAADGQLVIPSADTIWTTPAPPAQGTTTPS